ncbi:class I SAM-dependent methyltransferase [Phosphitispora fastidiosa]|uniref:class I SAM-dependent methyltransferase n=1 Tax=Phosphitispora fastidiosa TaxID=2837202 RepID=UPI001E619A12|nr:class I SAM-dependent methyltransferase [Phosphitispora fastidiosa]MBU7005927.1 ubiquinone/menaquinone biosynthesis C-methylase UbiE [Phosphitispora fastidiosa]
MINANNSENLFSGFASDYDRMIDWEKRLTREAPFFKRLFAERVSGKVLDTACATGRHALMFGSWGLQVAASDASSEMIDRARANALNSGYDYGNGIPGS